MKILFLSTWFPYPPDNGSKLRVYHLLRALAQAHEVTLVSFAFDTARPEQPADLRSCAPMSRSCRSIPLRSTGPAPCAPFSRPTPVVSRPIPAMSQLVTRCCCAAQPFDAVIASTEMMADYALHARSPGTSGSWKNTTP